MITDETFTTEFYNKLRGFRMMFPLKLAAGMNGGRKSNAKGSSVEFSDFREYILGDDIRRIDWNAYARFDKLFVKLFMEEKEGIFRIFLDTSASMDFGTPKKQIHAKRLAAALSYCILQSSDRVILDALKDDSVCEYRVPSGKQGFSGLVDKLSETEFKGSADITSIMRTDIKNRGMSVIISDLYTDRLEDVLKYLVYKKQEIIVIRVLSPEELEPAVFDTFSLTDSENGMKLKVTGGNTLIKEYKKTYDNHRRSLEAVCRKYGARFIESFSDRDFTRICT